MRLGVVTLKSIADEISPILSNLKMRGLKIKKVTPEERSEMEKKAEAEALKELYAGEKVRMINNSLISDFEDLKSNFDDFKVTNSIQKKELACARKIANEIYSGSKSNYVFTGKAGTGKTMLAVCILNGINKITTKTTCLFISVAMLMDLELATIGKFDEFTKDRAYRYEQLIKKSDLLVLDDLGSESVLVNNSEASNFTQKVLFRLADYRKNKPNIITTNNTSVQLRKMYNEKIVSRLLAKNSDNIVIFDGKDNRLV